MQADFQDHFDEELDIVTHALWGSDTIDKLEVLYRRAYYCTVTPREAEFRPELCPSNEELEWVVAELNQSTDRRRSGRLIRILKYEYRDWMAPSLVRFLEGPSSALAAEVLFILRGTKAVGEYANLFIKIMHGQPWDHVGSCQRIAMSCVDEYLYRHSHPMLLHELLNVYESEYDREVRDEALRSLGRAVDIYDLPAATILSRVKDRLADEKSQDKTAT